jgi:hypothetical protein
MAYLDPNTSTFQQNIDILQNGVPQQQSNIVELSPAMDSGSAAGGSSQGTTAQPSTGGQTTPQTSAPVQTITPGRTGNIYERLFNPVQTAAKADTGSLTSQYQGFQTKAGPSRTYESTGAQQSLQGAIAPPPQVGTSDYQKYQDNFNAAKGYLGAQYTGPKGLSEAAPQDWNALSEALNRLYSTSSALGTGRGLEDYVAQAVPGLTTGERAFEAQALMKDPNFKSQLGSAQKAAADLKAQQAAQVSQAEAFAQQRAGEESAIAQKSKDYLGGQKAGFITAEQAKVDAALAQQKAVQDAYAKFQAGGATPDAAMTSGIPYTEFDNRADAAKRIWADTMSQFDDIKDVPLMTLAIDSQGREQYVFPGGWKDNGIYAAGTKGAQAHQIRKRAMERQKALEAAGFSPGNKQMKLPKGAKNYIKAPLGEYAAYNPLYFGEAGKYSPADLREFASFDEGTTPTYQNQASPEELDRFNRILELLGQNEQQLQAPQNDAEAYRQAQIGIDTAGYTDAEKQALNRVSEALKAASVKEERAVNRARSKYRSTRNAFGGKQVIGKALGSQIGGGVGAAVGTVFGVGGGYPGYLAGSEVGGYVGGLI